MTTTQSTDLHADALAHDPRVVEAKRLMLEAMQEHQQRLTGVKEAEPALRGPYEKDLEHFAQVRGGKLWYPYIGSGLGNGVLVELADGSVKLDMIGGIGVHYMGHNHPKIVEASLNGALGDTVMQGHLMQNRESHDLCTRMTEAAGMDFCFLTSSGAMANENAMKIAFQKNAPAYRILAFKKAFMGRTLSIAQITDKPKYRDGLPNVMHVDYLPFYDHTRPEESTKETLAALHDHINRYPGQHALCVFELVQGEGGFYPGSEGYFKAVMDVLKEHHIAVLADEVQTFGRTHQLFGFQHFGLDQHVDIVTMGKLGQVCATLYNEEYKPRPGLLSQTFTSSTVAIHAAHAMLDELTNGEYFGDQGRNARINARFVERFQEIKGRHPELMHGPHGLGAMVAFQPYDGNTEKVLAFSHKLYEAGVICFVTGANPMRIRFLVAGMAVTDAQIDEVCEIVEKTLVDFA